MSVFEYLSTANIFSNTIMSDPRVELAEIISTYFCHVTTKIWGSPNKSSTSLRFSACEAWNKNLFILYSNKPRRQLMISVNDKKFTYSVEYP